MKYTIELISPKGNTIREFDGLETGARRFARNSIIQRGTDDWMAIIYKGSYAKGLEEVGKVWYDYDGWTFRKTKGKDYLMNNDGTLSKTKW